MANTKALEKKVTSLSNALAKLGDGSDLKQLLLIIRKPGWTTIAEAILVEGLVDSMAAHTQAIAQAKTVLMKGSNAVGGK